MYSAGISAESFLILLSAGWSLSCSASKSSRPFWTITISPSSAESGGRSAPDGLELREVAQQRPRVAAPEPQAAAEVLEHAAEPVPLRLVLPAVTARQLVDELGLHRREGKALGRHRESNATLSADAPTPASRSKELHYRAAEQNPFSERARTTMPGATSLLARILCLLGASAVVVCSGAVATPSQGSRLASGSPRSGLRSSAAPTAKAIAAGASTRACSRARAPSSVGATTPSANSATGRRPADVRRSA